MKNLINLHSNKLKMNLQLFADVTQSIYSLVKAPEIATYWTEKDIERPPYLGEELFPNNKQLGRDLAWFVGQTGAPKALRPSALDAAAIPRDRGEFAKITAKMFFFKENLYIDEDLRQRLLEVIQTGNQQLIDAVLIKIFDDAKNLIDGAAVTREIMRMQLLTTGTVSQVGNGQDFALDFAMPEDHKGHAKVSWTDVEKADPAEDLENALDKIEADSGERPTRAVLNSTTLRQLRNSKKIGINLYPNGGGNIRVSKADVIKYLADELELEAVVYSKLYKDTDGVSKKFVPDNIVSLLPAGELGSTWFGTTPEEADLVGANAANVEIVDTGVAVTTSQKIDPVNVDTKVSMFSLPSFEQIDKVYILNTIAKP